LLPHHLLTVSYLPFSPSNTIGFLSPFTFLQYLGLC
jgi:hypothetical protein